VALFTAQAAAVRTRVHRVPRADALDLVAGLVLDAGPGVAVESDLRAAIPELVPALRAAGATVATARAPKRELAEVAVGISFAAFGVAETGSVALASAEPEDRLVGMLPAVHVVLLPESALVAGLDEASERLAAGARLSVTVPGTAAHPATPYVSLVTGASRTSDIERVLTIGVHGPRALHVVLLTDE
jgi:L-lactate dehydrogenase complex protein LldG